MNTQSTESNVSSQTFVRRHNRRAYRSGGWVGGMMLIALGGLLLLNNLTGFQLRNWWALFILLPAVGAFSAAWRNYQEAGRMTTWVRSSIFGGLVLVIVASTFLFSLNWTIIGPAILVLVGVGLLINNFLPE